MAIAFVQKVNGTVVNGGSLTLPSLTASAGNILIAGISILQASTTAQSAITPTDTNGSWVDVGSPALSVDATTVIAHGCMGAYQKNCSAGSHAVTYTFPNGVSYAEAFVAEFSGVDTASPLDLTPASSNCTVTTNGNGTPFAGPLNVGTSPTLANANELIIVCGDFFAGGGFVNQGITDPPTGYTSLGAQQDTTLSVGAEQAYQIVSATTGVSASWTWTGSNIDDARGIIFSFQQAGAGASATPMLMTLGLG